VPPCVQLQWNARDFFSPCLEQVDSQAYFGWQTMPLSSCQQEVKTKTSLGFRNALFVSSLARVRILKIKIQKKG
jgi:hypothetical protein